MKTQPSNPLKTMLAQHNNHEKSSFTRERYKEMVKAQVKLIAEMKVVTEHINACADVVGSYKLLAEIIEPNEGQIREWRKGTKMKATTAMKFEEAFNSEMKRRGLEFRCDRCKLIAWFFVSEVTK